DIRGDVFVSDSYNHRIQQLSPMGTPRAIWGSRGGQPGQFRRPEGLVVDDAGGMVVIDADNDRLLRYVPSLTP
ncbi:MAG TPA: 6-bladed beta-propeller, partial [Chloroflexota bacterium]|nr:6-bladed beta-propeller [Chloroflexota bacterium]